MKVEVKEFINGKVTYDKNGGQYFWISNPKGGVKMLAEMRGYGCIKNMFKELNDANDFQDKVGRFIADAINEKLEREK